MADGGVSICAAVSGGWLRTELEVHDGICAEINGRAIAVFNAENDIQAEGRASSKPFRGELTVLENEGQPLWNGADEILVRKALPAEEAQFDASRARAIKNKEIDVDDDWLMFLVPVTDPTGDFDPYDAPGG